MCIREHSCICTHAYTQIDKHTQYIPYRSMYIFKHTHTYLYTYAYILLLHTVVVPEKKMYANTLAYLVDKK